MSQTFSVSIKREQFPSFREYYDEENVEDAIDCFKEDVIEMRDEIHEEVLDD